MSGKPRTWRRNKATGKHEYSEDGGKTWKTQEGDKAGSASASGGAMSGGNAEARQRSAEGIANLRRRQAAKENTEGSSSSSDSGGGLAAAAARAKKAREKKQ